MEPLLHLTGLFAQMGEAHQTNAEDVDVPIYRSRYEVPSAAHKELGFWVHAAGYNRLQQPHPEWTRVLGHYAAVYVSRGNCWFKSSPTGKLTVTPGTLFWLFPTVGHSYTPNVGETWTEQWVIFNGPVAETYERQGFYSPSRPFVQVGDNPEIARLF